MLGRPVFASLRRSASRVALGLVFAGCAFDREEVYQGPVDSEPESSDPPGRGPGQPGNVCLMPGYRCDDPAECNREWNYCFLPDDPCAGFDCGGEARGYCAPLLGLPTCICEDGYDNERYEVYCCPTSGGDPSCVG